jgi:hypothetical protein
MRKQIDPAAGVVEGVAALAGSGISSTTPSICLGVAVRSSRTKHLVAFGIIIILLQVVVTGLPSAFFLYC